MAQHASAKKRHRQSLKRYARNRHYRTTVRSAIRRARSAAAEGSEDTARYCQDAERLLRKASGKGAMHQSTVSRTVSRLQKLLKRAG
jgi:small subunit ribosomal protein S20